MMESIPKEYLFWMKRAVINFDKEYNLDSAGIGKVFLSDKKGEMIDNMALTPPQIRLSFLKISKVFIIDDYISNLFNNIKNKGDKKFPFNHIFIDCNLNIYKNMYASGILIYPNNPKTTHFSVMYRCHFVPDTASSYMGFDYPFNDVVKVEFANYAKTIEEKEIMKEIKEAGVIIPIKITEFINNFLDFLETPDVELITVERSEEQNAKRIKRGKPPIPTVHNVRVTGKLKIYLDKLNSNPDFKYSHQFDVRGHWRTLRSDKWKSKAGTRIWIPPYIKGEGIYIKKNYEVKDEN